MALVFQSGDLKTRGSLQGRWVAGGGLRKAKLPGDSAAVTFLSPKLDVTFPTFDFGSRVT